MTRKGILEFDLEDTDAMKAFKRAVIADEAHIVLSDISNEIFRPHRKHGYPDRRIQKYIDDLGKSLGDDKENPILEVISLLEDNFRDILMEHGVIIE